MAVVRIPRFLKVPTLPIAGAIDTNAFYITEDGASGAMFYIPKEDGSGFREIIGEERVSAISLEKASAAVTGLATQAALNSAITGLASQTSLTAAVTALDSAKADKTYVEAIYAELLTRAGQADLEALAAVVGGKAEASDLSYKADKTTVDALADAMTGEVSTWGDQFQLSDDGVSTW